MIYNLLNFVEIINLFFFFLFFFRYLTKVKFIKLAIDVLKKIK